MKTIGIIGGLSWESTALYYAAINRAVRDKLGGRHSALIALQSLDFAEVEELQIKGDWGALRDMLVAAAKKLEAAGADFLVIACNTMHRAYEPLKERTRLPILHIADCVGENARGAGFKTVGLLGTLYTMEQGFYHERLSSRHGLKLLVPDRDDRERVQQIIYEELCEGIVLEESRVFLHEAIERLKAAGAEGVVLGCTELALLTDAKRSTLQLLDSGALHARRAAEVALGERDI